MTILTFPPVTEADEDGLLAIGGDLDVNSILLAYRSGIFLWPPNRDILAWFAPPERAVLFFDNFHLSRSFKKEVKKANFTVGFNTQFQAVMERCAELKNRKKQRGTWITEEVIEAYTRLHKLGYAHSVETYNGPELVGGVYGIAINGLFAGESMFYREPNASKFALFHLVEYLKTKGVTWMDMQVLNPFTEKIGAIEIPRADYMKLLEQALKAAALFPKTDVPAV